MEMTAEEFAPIGKFPSIHDFGVNWYFPYYMEDLMAELTHTPPGQHHPSFPGGSKFLEGQEMARMHGLQCGLQ